MMSNLDLVKSAYDFFAAGKVPAVLKMFASDVVWLQCPGFPWIEGDGNFTGAEAIVKNVFAPIPKQYDGFVIDVVDFIDGGDKVVMEGYYTGVYKATGKAFRANAAHIWTIKDGKAARIFQCVDVATIINP
jgi:ketosteroid isomerase-like protein